MRSSCCPSVAQSKGSQRRPRHSGCRQGTGACLTHQRSQSTIEARTTLPRRTANLSKRIAGRPFTAAAAAPGVRLDDPAGQHRPFTLESLPGDLKPEFLEAAERGQVRASEGSVRHVEVLQMGSVRTSILRPRPLPGHRRADRRYTLNCEEPDEYVRLPPSARIKFRHGPLAATTQPRMSWLRGAALTADPPLDSASLIHDVPDDRSVWRRWSKQAVHGPTVPPPRTTASTMSITAGAGPDGMFRQSGVRGGVSSPRQPAGTAAIAAGAPVCGRANRR